MEFERSSGILLHVTSLPEGKLGEGARDFVRWLGRAGQRWWQVLPLGPPDETGSPYQARSAFARWPGLLERPRERVSRAERDDFRDRHRFWIEGWERFAGDGAVDHQVRFEREWRALRDLAAEHGVKLLGDVPIYAGRGGADVETWPWLFLEGAVAGAPPDALSDEGQLWGNPLFDWPAHRREHYRWWVERFARTFDLVDACRIDHFRGFVAYWAVPEGATSAKDGRWRRGPGRAVFDAILAQLGGLPFVAENLGVITPPVERLRKELGLPGMAVLLFGFGGGAANPHRPANVEEDGVVYTSTHDTETTREWYEALPQSARRRTGLDPSDPAWSLIRVAWGTRARVALTTAQDVLGLGPEGRMNRPGTTEGNWAWRLRAGRLTNELADRLREETEAAGRT
jgi:4-alpha-glucanotransferase